MRISRRTDIWSKALSGIILFSPEALEVHPGAGGTRPVQMALITTRGLDAFDLLIGSNSVPISGFSFSNIIVDQFPNRTSAEPAGLGLYKHEIWVLANRSMPLPSTILDIGTFQAELGGLEVGTHFVEAWSGLGEFEPVEVFSGDLAIRVILEPTTFSLLAIGAGAWWMGRRRRGSGSVDKVERA